MEDIRILCLDTSARSLTVGIAGIRNGERYADGSYLPDCGLTHSEIMMREVDRCLSERGLALGDFDAFAAVVGPGSFTGIRIGVTTVRALCQALGKRCLAVNSLERLAYHVEGGRICAVDAMHGKLYCAVYGEDGRELAAPFVCERDRFRELVARYPYPVFADFALEGASACGDPLSCLCDCALDRALAGQWIDYRELQPLYLRSSQAEETLRAKEGNSVRESLVKTTVTAYSGAEAKAGQSLRASARVAVQGAETSDEAEKKGEGRAETKVCKQTDVTNDEKAICKREGSEAEENGR